MVENVINYPHLSEKSVEMVDEQNTLIFMVDDDSTKPVIQDAVESMFDVDVANVNTQRTQSGEKKAYVKLTPDHEALDIATELGML